MAQEIRQLSPKTLTGPRTYFTDLDPKDSDFNEQDMLRRLKLQLLLKKTVVIAASSLFHDTGLTLFQTNQGLIPALEQGVIVPALRDQYLTPEEFFVDKADYSPQSRRFFTAHVRYTVPWNLAEASEWFRQQLFLALVNPESVLRKGAGISEVEARQMAMLIEQQMANEPPGSRFLQREHIRTASRTLDRGKAIFVENYGHLLYRLQGAHVVCAEGHFPQSNLTRLALTKEEAVLSDTGIFWDLYVEAVLSALNSAVRLTPERLDRLGFADILRIRKDFFNSGFSEQYDALIASAKKEVPVHDPDRFILDMMR